jgi:hypothetical protein
MHESRFPSWLQGELSWTWVAPFQISNLAKFVNQVACDDHIATFNQAPRHAFHLQQMIKLDTGVSQFLL